MMLEDLVKVGNELGYKVFFDSDTVFYFVKNDGTKLTTGWKFNPESINLLPV